MFDGKKQQGGSVLGNGTYGCVYYPALLCKDKKLSQKHEKDAMKLMRTTNWTEIEISRTVSRIDPNGHYFLPLQGDSCEIDATENLVTSCPPYQNSLHKDQFKGYFLPYGGLTLQSKFKGNEKVKVYQFWMWLSYLIGSLKILQSAEIVHFDIKSNNIVIASDGNPRLIDFGLSFYTNDITFMEYYSIQPLFVSAFVIAFKGDTIAKLYEDYEYLAQFFDKDYVKSSPNDPILSTYNQIKKTLGNVNEILKLKYDEQVKAIQENSYVREVIKPNLEKIDLYMLILAFNNHFGTLKADFMKKDPNLTAMIANLINQNLNIDLTKQWTLAQNLKECDRIDAYVKTKTEARQRKQRQEAQAYENDKLRYYMLINN
jgi:serine/threonine protein kinase